MHMTRWIASLALLLAIGCQKDTTEPKPVIDTNVPVCLTAPEPSGNAVVLSKGPYLQWPTPTSMVVRFEADSQDVAHVAVWLPNEQCLVSLVETTGTVMPMPKNIGNLPAPVGFQHSATLEGLSPGTLYQYKVIAGTTVSFPYTFRTAPNADQGYTVAILGDTRTHDVPHQAVIDAISLLSPDLTVNTGDAMGSGGVLADWEGFFAIEDTLLHQSPLMPAYGNHEAILGFPYYTGYWHLPNSYQAEELNYAFTYGNSAWIVLDSNSLPDAKRQAWIDDQLTQAADARYLFVVFHHPVFSFSKHVPNAKWEEKLHPVFLAHNVTAVFNGHNHCYEHFVVDDLHYIVTGGGGAPLYGINEHIVPDMEDKRVAARKSHHFMLATFTHTEATFVVHDVDAENVIETFSLTPRIP
jgi:hypothetical protein